jgi:ABC-type transport system involved in multi-copper enzyme maturation permease subunit
MQLTAVLLDSLRLLRSRSLFWLCLGLSMLAAFTLFGTYSFNEQGVRFFWFETWDNPMLVEGSKGSRDFVGTILDGFYVKFWLGWGAMILAIVSTASILPDFLASGAVELSLCRPIDRLRLFFYKILGALLFVLLQCALGITLAWLLIGLKFDMWIHGVLWAIPLITLQFFFIYSFSALLAVITRSTLACVIGTLLCWFVVFILQFGSTQIESMVLSGQSFIRQNNEDIADIRANAAKDNRELSARDKTRIANREADNAQQQKTVDRVAPWSKTFRAVEIIIPKTSDISTIIANAANAPISSDFSTALQGGREGGPFVPRGVDPEDWKQAQTASGDVERALRDLNTWKSIGSSTASTLVIIGLAAWLFRRRDF